MELSDAQLQPSPKKGSGVGQKKMFLVFIIVYYCLSFLNANHVP